jgi:hypothetical protein
MIRRKIASHFKFEEFRINKLNARRVRPGAEGAQDFHEQSKSIDHVEQDILNSQYFSIDDAWAVR